MKKLIIDESWIDDKIKELIKYYPMGINHPTVILLKQLKSNSKQIDIPDENDLEKMAEKEYPYVKFGSHMGFAFKNGCKAMLKLIK